MEMWWDIGSDDKEIEEETQDMVMSRRPPPPRPGIYAIAEMLVKKGMSEEENRNMKMWGRKDDPRLDPTSEFFDPLKLVHKDVEDGDYR